MPRPRRCRRIQGRPHYNEFGPKGVQNKDFISLLLEEYETIRLIDYNGMTQEECADSMQVARTTVQKIYSDARKKIADAIIEGKTLVIDM
jgi:predicted DNA-binding protein (UPF0251 family)